MGAGRKEYNGTGDNKMIKEIISTRAETNLQVFDVVKFRYTEMIYRVAYIDLVEARALLVSLDYVNNTLVIDLCRCDEFVIVT